MRAHDRGAVEHTEDMGRNRAAEPAVGRRRRYRVDEALARGAEEERQAKPAEPFEPGDRLHALLRRLAEADAGIEHDAVAPDAGARGDVERACEEALHLRHDVERRIGALAVVYDDDRTAASGHG